MVEFATLIEPNSAFAPSAGYNSHVQAHLLTKGWAEIWFPIDAMVMWTEFRSNVLNYIYRTAFGLCYELLESAYVTVTSTPDEKQSFALDLMLTVNTDWDNLQTIECQIFDKIAEWSQEWSAEEIEDYANHIYFGLIPSQL